MYMNMNEYECPFGAVKFQNSLRGRDEYGIRSMGERKLRVRELRKVGNGNWESYT